MASWPERVPDGMVSMARILADTFAQIAARLLELGLGYLGLDRAAATLSTGERQRVQLARAVRNETTGVLYVLDEPSIGLHPVNVDGLLGVMRDLLRDGNSVVFVDHDVQVLREADWLIEMGPGSGADGGRVLSAGAIEVVERDPASLLAGFLTGGEGVVVRERAGEAAMFEHGTVRLVTRPRHTVHALDLELPRGRVVAVTGVSGSGKTTLVLESLVPALRAADGSVTGSVAGSVAGSGAGAGEAPLPRHVASIDPGGIARVQLVDATPIGINVRSTVATYSGVMDDLRRAYARLEAARSRDLTAADFSYNTGSLRCPRCEGTGQIVLDVQFLPDVDIDCPDCEGRRYAPAADEVRRPVRGAAADAADAALSLPEVLGLTVREAAARLADLRKVRSRLQTLDDLGLGYLTLGEATPALSGGEAQRLKLAGELDRDQADTLFVLDEPSVGLHPLDVRVLIGVIERLNANGATVVIIEHDLDMIANADWVIDMGPGGGADGGRVVATGTPEQIARLDASTSVTAGYLARHLSR